MLPNRFVWQVSGTHPAGMLSCFIMFFVSISNRILYATAITNGSLTGPTHVPVLLSGMNCDGDELNIQNCEHDGLTSSGQCDTHPAGVLCIGILDLFALH